MALISADCIKFSPRSLILPIFCVLIRSANSVSDSEAVGHYHDYHEGLATLRDKSCCKFALLFYIKM